MSIAITEDHRSLADTAADFLAKQGAREANRALLEAETESLPPFWGAMAELGWLGLHLPEANGGSGFGLSELVIVVEELGRAVAPGPFVPTVVASATLAAAGSPDVSARWLAGLADGTLVGAVALGGSVSVTDGQASGSAGVVIGGGLADVILVVVGDDVAVVDVAAGGVSTEIPKNLDPSRRAARVVLDGASVEVLPGAASTLVDRARLLFAAEATGIARECTDQAVEYAKVREQFGRPIAMFQAVKHHCANMLVATEMATAAVWDAARAEHDGDQFSLTAAMAAALALPAAAHNAQMNIQVHGGIGFTWEHDAHLYVRRIGAIEAVLDPETAAEAVTDLTRAGVKRANTVDLPPEAEPVRDEVLAFVARIASLDADAQRAAMIDEGYAMPHWPRPYGREAGAIEQLVIEQEFTAAGIAKPAYGITGWVILTLIQHATDDQVSRWVRPALNQDLIWCQLFSEPDAGSDAAGVKTRATRTDGGWLVNGQKVWTSGAHQAAFGLATVRTDPDAPKHNGITTMVIDMHASGVEVRPLRMPTGQSEFNEVFFNDVFVPDDDVVGPVDGGWTVARATLGNESVSIGGGAGGGMGPGDSLVTLFDEHPDRPSGGAGRIGRYLASTQTMGVLNLRTASRAVTGSGPGPEGAVTKLVLTENGHEASAMLSELTGPDAAFFEGPGMMPGFLLFMNRGMSIAGGTSEIKRNQIGERILGMPRDPLVK